MRRRPVGTRPPGGAGRGPARRLRRTVSAGTARREAGRRLAPFRRASKLALGVTALTLLLVGTPGAVPGESEAGASPLAAVAGLSVAGSGGGAAQSDTSMGGDTVPTRAPAESARRATGTLRALGRTTYNLLPALGIALLVLLAAGLLAKLVGMVLRRVLASWERAQATAALVSIGIWLVALGAALSIVAGDARALVGSVGLFGLALSWALQGPIESFTGWLLNSFRSYYRIGDRVAVGDVFGDVARIDFLTTTVFEAGGPQKSVQAAQSTGALITFPNSEILRSNVVNYTRDFPYVWDELTVSVANESDLGLAMAAVQRVADREVGERMEAAAQEYAALLERARLAWDVATRPAVYVSARDSWTDLVVRYLVPAREMRKWSTRLLLAVNAELAQPSLREAVFPAYNRSQVQPVPPPQWATRDSDREGT